MVSKHAFLASLLLASAAYALVSSHMEARHDMSGLPKSTSSPSEELSANNGPDDTKNWAGAVWDKKKGTFHSVTGTFIVPSASGASGTGAAIWVGIDGHTCTSAILQTGLQLLPDPVVGTTVAAWYEWFPDYLHYFYLAISVNDTIRASVTAFDTTSGVASIENLSTGQSVYENLTSTSALCLKNAEWIVEDYQLEDGSYVPFADFGTVTFTDANAYSKDGALYTPTGATIVDIRQDKKTLTSVSTMEDSVTITYR